MAGKPTFVIGDVHGSFDSLAALLEEIKAVDGDGNRLRDDIEIVQLGDLGQFGHHSEGGDLACYKKADEWFDYVLWGNHDRAAFDRHHHFKGYFPPPNETKDIMKDLVKKHTLVMAHEAHGYLLTHAGLGSYYISHFPNGRSPEELAKHLNSIKGPDPIIDTVSRYRSRSGRYGGVLWRDYQETILDVPQVFGHSRHGEVKIDNDQICVDVGSRYNGRLAGVWLPSQEVVEIRLDT